MMDILKALSLRLVNFLAKTAATGKRVFSLDGYRGALVLAIAVFASFLFGWIWEATRANEDLTKTVVATEAKSQELLAGKDKAIDSLKKQRDDALTKVNEQAQKMLEDVKAGAYWKKECDDRDGLIAILRKRLEQKTEKDSQGKQTQVDPAGRPGRPVLFYGNDAVPVAVTEARLSEFTLALVKKDLEAAAVTALDGGVFFVRDNTRVNILESGWTKMKVRILEGEHVGATGWVVREWVRE